MTELTPIFRGTLGTIPLAHVLIRLTDERFTGTLVLEAPGGHRSAVFFQTGQPAKSKTHEGVHFLGEVLLEAGIVDLGTHADALAAVGRERRLYGEILISQGKLNSAQLREALTEQLLRKLEWMFTLPAETLYGAYLEQNLLERWGGAELTPVSVLPLLWRSVRRHASEAAVTSGVARLGDRILKLHPASQLARFGFAHREQALVDVLRARPLTVQSLLDTGLLDQLTTKKLVYVLALTRQIDLGRADPLPVGAGGWNAAPRSPGEAPASPPRERMASINEMVGAPPAPPSQPQPGNIDGERESQLAEIRAFAERLDGLDYYEILGLDRQAPNVAVQRAYLELAKKWHPDKMGTGLEEVRSLVTRAFARISEARAVLADPEGRKQYDEVLRSGGGKSGEQEEVTRVLRAAAAYQRAEVLMKKGNLVLAEKEAQVAYEGDPEQADHAALYAWLLAQQSGRVGSGQFEDVIALLDKAAEREPNNIRVRYYRGQVQKRAGRMNKAIRDFRFVVEKNPNHVDAAREVRLYEIRRSDRQSQNPEPPKRNSERPKAPDSNSGGGIFGRLFKR